MPATSALVLATTVVAETAAASGRLVERLEALHPDAVVVVLSVDGTPARAGETFTPEHLRLQVADRARRIGRTSPVEGARALLPELGRLLLDEHRRVVLVDPVVEVIGPLDDVAIRDTEALRLVPRALAGPPVDDRHPDPIEVHTDGVHLPTLVGIGPGAGDVLAWWSDAWARRPETGGALLDLIATRVPVSVCRAPGQGVNSARIGSASRFETAAGRLLLDGEAVASIDTSGRTVEHAHLLSNRPGLRARLAEHHALAELLAERDAATGDDSPAAAPDLATRIYAEALRHHELVAEPEPPPPDDTEAFNDWLRRPDTRSDGLSRLAMGLWRSRIDLQHAFPAPDLGPANRAEFVDWIRRDGAAQERLDPDLLPPPVASAEPLVPGVDLAGYLDADLGVGEIARLVAMALEHAGVATAIQTIGGSANRRSTALIPADDGPRHPVEILCVNADRIAGIIGARGRPSDEIHTVGVFFWETDVPTEAMRAGMAAVDEIWAGSRYVAEQFLRWTDRPVHVLPVPVVPPAPVGDGRELLGVEGDRPIVLLAYDFHSVARRKNPDGLMEAFRSAVAPDEGPVLVLKSINGDRVPDELDRLRWAVRDRADIRLVDGYVTPGELSAMIRDAAVYASLHRAEGFGLTIAHAMALGTPVLCTEGSGPADFLDADRAVVVPATRSEVGAGADPYPPDGTWWDPDLGAAATGLRRLLDDAASAARLADAASRSIADHTVEATAAFLAERMDAGSTRRGWWRR